jgi:hypothetical protein
MNDLTDAELTMLWDVQNVAQWDRACLKIRRVRGGAYPPDWYRRVKGTGMMDEIFRRWGETPQLRLNLGER